MGHLTVIAVGVDGSDSSLEALSYAADEATVHDAVLRVVTAFESAGRFGDRYGVPIPMSDEQIAHKIEGELRAQVQNLLLAQSNAPRTETVVRAGSAGWVLSEESKRADLLVVGHRGRGSLTSKVLGSVGLHVVLHARCPVTVVRPSPLNAGSSNVAATPPAEAT